MAKDLTHWEVWEETAYSLIINASLIGLACCGIFFMLSSGFSLAYVALSFGIALVIGYLLDSYRFSEKRGFIGDAVSRLRKRVTELESQVQALGARGESA